MRSLQCTLIPQDWGPDKKRRSGHRHTQRDGPERKRGGDRQAARPGGGLRKTSPAHSWVWESSLQDWRQAMSAVWAAQAVGLSDGGLSCVVILTLYTELAFKTGFRSTSS